MRQTFAVALLTSALVLTPAAFAQRGAAGHAGGFSGGGHFAGSPGRSFSGFSGRTGFSAPASGFGRFAPRGYSYSGAPRYAYPAPARALTPLYRSPYAAGRSWGITSSRGDHDRYRSPYRGYGGYGLGYPWLNSWDILPWDLGYPDFAGYDDSYDYGDVAAQPQPDTDQQPAEAWPPDAEDGPANPYRPDYGVAMSAPPPPVDAQPVGPEPELTLIFRDGHHEAIHNYVLTQNTVIVLDQASSGRQQRIPLAELNVPATEQAARDAGLDFAPPA